MTITDQWNKLLDEIEATPNVQVFRRFGRMARIDDRNDPENRIIEWITIDISTPPNVVTFKHITPAGLPLTGTIGTLKTLTGEQALQKIRNKQENN